jgi:SAM-dependent methyltransferase
MPQSALHPFRWRALLWKTHDFTINDLEDRFHEICAGIDLPCIVRLERETLENRRRSAVSAAKYADYGFWLRRNIVRAVALGLHRLPPLKILDLGCGPAYFLAVCRSFGHHITGMDLPLEELPPLDSRVYTGMASALHSTEAILRFAIRPFTPLAVDGTFDLITAYQVCFNKLGPRKMWSAREWAFFLNDAVRHLRPGGRLILDLNDHRENFGSLLWYDEPTLALFRSLGKVDRREVVIAGSGSH